MLILDFLCVTHVALWHQGAIQSTKVKRTINILIAHSLENVDLANCNKMNNDPEVNNIPLFITRK